MMWKEIIRGAVLAISTILSSCGGPSELLIRDVYNPLGRAETNGRRLEDTLQSIEKETTTVYAEVNDSHRTWFSDAKVTVSMERDPGGFLQPSFSFYQNGSLKERVYFSEIENVAGMVIGSENGDYPLLLLAQRQEVQHPDHFPYSRIKYFDVRLRGNLNAVSETLATLSLRYQQQKALFLDRNSEYRAVVREEVKGYVEANLTEEESSTICSFSGIEGKNVRQLAVVDFGECSSLPLAGDLDSLALKIKGYKGSLLFCGNALQPLPPKCFPYNHRPCNVSLTFDRAAIVASFIQGAIGRDKEYSLNVYPNAVKLDSQLVHVYAVED